MYLYASTIAVPIKVNNPITIGSTPSVPITISSTPSVPTETDYNYWLDSNTYVFNRGSNNDDIYWKTTTVTIDEDYTLKLITNYTNGYYYVLYCDNTFTNNGNVIIDNYSALGLNNNYTSNNYGTIDIINGVLGLYTRATLNNKGTITLKDSSFIYIASSSTLNNTGTITFEDSSYIYINNSTVTNTGTIDISNITNISYWYNYDGTFTLEGGSTFILPKSIPIPNINNFNITLSCTGISIKGNSNIRRSPYLEGSNIIAGYKESIEEYTGFIVDGWNESYVKDCNTDKYTLSDIANTEYNSNTYTLSTNQDGIDPKFDKDSNVRYILDINSDISINSRVSFNNTTIRLNGGNITSTYPINLIGNNTIDMCNKPYTPTVSTKDNNIKVSILDGISNTLGISFTGNISNLKFININSSNFKTISNILSSPSYNSPKYTLDISQLGIIPTIKDIDTIDTKLIIPEGYTLTVTGNIKVNSIWDVKGTINSNNNITYTKVSSSNVKGGNIRSSIRTNGGKIVFK